TGWVNPDVIGIDLGITILGAENARTQNVWRWFMRNTEITKAMDLIGLRQYTGKSKSAPSSINTVSAVGLIQYRNTVASGLLSHSPQPLEAVKEIG
ncbi:MAG TPA: hypothetical protein VF074_02475, partial [Pyrinomonadaceae bacterium]